MGSHWRRAPSPALRPRLRFDSRKGGLTPDGRYPPVPTCRGLGGPVPVIAGPWPTPRAPAGSGRAPAAGLQRTLAGTRDGLVASLAPAWIWWVVIALGTGVLVASSGLARAFAVGVALMGGWGLVRARSTRRTIRECLGWSGLAKCDRDWWQGHDGSCR